MKRVEPIIGQEAVCPHGLGRVIAYDFKFPNNWIEVRTYIGESSCKYDACNVKLVEIRYQQ